MSHALYDEELRNAQDLLSGTLAEEPTQADRREQRFLLAKLYVRYIMIANRLSEVVDQMVQPQKRFLVRKLLEATLGRIIELKHDLVEADLCEWTYIGDIIEALNISSLEIELNIPSYFLKERAEEITNRNKQLKDILRQYGFLDKKEEKVPMSEFQAILLIQTHERARQGRLRAQFMKEIKTMKERSKQGPEVEEKGSKSLAAALLIQKLWRGYSTRRQTRRRKLEEMLLIGMIPPPQQERPEITKALQVEEERRQLQSTRHNQYEEAIKSIRADMEKNQREIVLEQLKDQVRNWLREYQAQTGKLPEYTGSERSVSRLMLSRTGTESELSKSSSSKESKSKRSKTSKSKDSKSTEESEDESTKAIVSTFVPELTLRNEEYEEMWKDKDESGNPHQYHYSDIIYNEQMLEMENELRKVVDEMMKSELELLQEAYERDKGYKGKKAKKASKKVRRGIKKSKKKKEKDLTPDRTTESLFEELVANGIIRSYPEVYLKDFQAERSLSSPVPHNKGEEPKMALGELRQVLKEYCVLPLISSQINQQTPQIKSLMIAGPKGSGKDMLVHAVCTEVGAVLFDLTPSNIVGKYPGRFGLTMLIHLVVKVSKLLQPSIIYMDNAERPFVKKIPKTDKTDPKRLKKDLPKLMKNFSSEDRVILIGVSNCPWDADQKLLQQVYQKYLYIPRPNYSSRYCIWKYLLGQYSAISWQFDISGMSKISDGYTAGAIVSTVKEVITVKRMVQLRIQPLSPLELINALCKLIPVYKEEEECFISWWSKTPTCKRRTQAIEALLEEEAEMKAKQANAKKKK